jgi:hypothetical protein
VQIKKNREVLIIIFKNNQNLKKKTSLGLKSQARVHG